MEQKRFAGHTAAVEQRAQRASLSDHFERRCLLQHMIKRRVAPLGSAGNFMLMLEASISLTFVLGMRSYDLVRPVA